MAPSIPRIIGLSNGDAIKKDMVEPKGTPAFRNPMVIGIVEQAQNGVNAPKPAATIFPKTPAPESLLRIFSSGTYIRIISTSALINTNKAISSMVISTKYRSVSISVFIIVPLFTLFHVHTTGYGCLHLQDFREVEAGKYRADLVAYTAEFGIDELRRALNL